MEHIPNHGLAPGGTPSGQYEFSDHENMIVGRTGQRSTIWGLIAAATGVVMAAAMVGAFLLRDELSQKLDPNYVTIFIVACAPLALVNLSVAGLYLGAGKAMKDVVETRGNDVQHMIAALRKLANAFLLEVLVSIVAICVGITLGFWLAMNQPEPANVETVAEAADTDAGDDAEDEADVVEEVADTDADEEDEEGEEEGEAEGQAAGADTEAAESAAPEGEEAGEGAEAGEAEGDPARDGADSAEAADEEPEAEEQDGAADGGTPTPAGEQP